MLQGAWFHSSLHALLYVWRPPLPNSNRRRIGRYAVMWKSLIIYTERAVKSAPTGGCMQDENPVYIGESTTLNVARSKRGTSGHLPEKVGNHSKRVDAALQGGSMTACHRRKPVYLLKSEQAWQDSTLTSTESE